MNINSVCTALIHVEIIEKEILGMQQNKTHIKSKIVRQKSKNSHIQISQNMIYLCNNICVRGALFILCDACLSVMLFMEVCACLLATSSATHSIHTRAVPPHPGRGGVAVTEKN